MGEIVAVYRLFLQQCQTLLLTTSLTETLSDAINPHLTHSLTGRYITTLTKPGHACRKRVFTYDKYQQKYVI